jgi:hypothetical protein
MTKKYECQACGHVHQRKKPKSGNAQWRCMAKGCACVQLVVAGKVVG